jgi:DHA3 family tetracycline resistance protein-like MFS transporter
MSPFRRRLLPATTVYLLMSLAMGSFSSMAFLVAPVYGIVRAGLDPLRLVLVGTVLETMAFVFEIPTGIVADAVSRRRSVIVGTVLVGVGLILWGAVPSFGSILAAQVLWAVGSTFTSGADVAWITDEVGPDRAAILYVRAAQWNRAGALAGIVAGVGLGTVALGLPLVVGGSGILGLAGFLLVTMPEDGFTRPSRSSQPRLGAELLSNGRHAAAAVRANPGLVGILAVAAFHGASTEGFDRLADFHLLRDVGLPTLGGMSPVVWFGLIATVSMLLSILALQGLKRWEGFASPGRRARTLAGMNVALIAAVAGFGLAGGFVVAVALLWAVRILRSAFDPVYTAWLNRGLDPATRATINSAASQMDALGQMGGGPMLGLVAAARSVRAAIVLSALLRAPANRLFSRDARVGAADGP